MRRILLVDDDRLAAAYVVAALRGVPWRSEVCTSVADATSRLEERWDLVLMDVELADGSGLDLVARLRDRENVTGRRRTPVLVVTGHRDERVLREALEVGADGVLVKPVQPALLRQALARFARIDTPPPLPEVGVDDLAAQLIADLDVLLTPLREAIERGDLERARALGHRVAGTAGSLGLAAIAAAARRVAIAAEAGDAAGAASAAEALRAATRTIIPRARRGTRGAR